VPEPQPPAGVKPVGSEQGAAPVIEPAEQLSAPVARPSATVSPPPASTEKAAAAAVDKAPVARAAPAAEKKPAPEKLQLDTNNLPVAWVVQVGAMSTQASADKLKAQLIAKGFKAYTQSVKLASGSTVVKVFVGPKLSRERADAQKRAIDAALNTNAMVVRFPAG
jgi:DedD protein